MNPNSHFIWINDLALPSCNCVLQLKETPIVRIGIFVIVDVQIKVVKEVSTSLTPSTLVMDGYHVCFAMGSQYCMLDVRSGDMQELIIIDSPEQLPIIHRVSKVIKVLSLGCLIWLAKVLFISNKYYIGRVSADWTWGVRSICFVTRILRKTSNSLLQCCFCIDFSSPIYYCSL